MKTVRFAKFLSIAPLFLLIFAFSQTANAQRSNVIEGQIFDEYRNPVENAYVELLDSMDYMIRAVRSSSQGRYTFRGMVKGQYTVLVKPFGTNLLSSSQIVNVYNATARAEYFNVDFTLREDRRLRPQMPIKNETIYAQEVPEDARELYESGKKKLANGNDKGMKDLEAALAITPNYFNALRELGTNFVLQRNYEAAYPHLLKAIDVYKRCGECYYSLALAFYGLNQNDAAVTAADAAVALLPASGYARLMLGIALRRKEKFGLAKEALLRAQTLFEEPNAEVFWQLSFVYNRLNENEKAAEALEEYLKVSPDLKKDQKKNVEDIIAKMRAGKEVPGQ
jgi:tetratricopeptide (TPR) repeat protein